MNEPREPRRRLGPRHRTRAGTGRRSGPPDEQRWWDPAAQAIAEQPVLHRRQLGWDWLDASMVNNVERLDPFGHDAASEAIRAARVARVLRGLDEGRAWRRRKENTLLVARVEVFADADEAAHRHAWRDHAEAALDATWRLRWHERGRAPGWIETRWVRIDERPGALHAFRAHVDPPEPARSVDWLRIEDHTGHRSSGTVAVYEHLTLWAGERHGVLTLRHDLDVDVTGVAAAAAVAVLERLHLSETP